MWAIIPKYKNYFINEYGRVKNKTGRVLTQHFVNNYARVTLSKKGKRKHMKVHRLVAMTFLENEDDKPCVDHIDGNKLNNNVGNLRWCTHTENSMNMKKKINCSSTYKGVSKCKDKWSARITVKGIIVFLGYFDEENDAAERYNEKALIHFGEFAKLNIII